MFHNRLLSVVLAGALVIMAGLTIRQAVATTEVVTGASDGAATTLDGQPAAAGPNTAVHAYPYLSGRDECFDAPLEEAVACRKARRAAAEATAVPTPVGGSPLDECFDVGLLDTCAER
jgi:hypothetical protein